MIAAPVSAWSISSQTFRLIISWADRRNMNLFNRMPHWKPGNVCDVCNQHTTPEEAYLLTTSQVVSNSFFWQKFLTQNPKIRERDPEGATWATYVAKVVELRTPWQVCEQCIGLFDRTVPPLNKEAAKQYSLKSQQPPGTGASNISHAGIPAAHAWVKLYNSMPKSIHISDK